MSSKKKAANKEKGTIAIKYGVAIPVKSIMELIRLDCAGKIMRLSQGFMKWSPGQIFSKMKALGDVFNATSAVLDLIQGEWKDDMHKYAATTKPPQKFCPEGCKPSKVDKSKKGLSEIEQRKIRALRKQGLPIKAIGKEIHRAEKLVAEFVRTLPKK